MALTDDLRAQIQQLFTSRWEEEKARRSLEIKTEIDGAIQKIELEKQRRVQFFTAIGGISLVAFLTLAFTNIQKTATTSAEDAVQSAIDRVESAELRLNDAAKKFTDIEVQVTQRFGTIETSRKQIDDKLSEIDRALGAIRTAEGGIAITEELRRIYKDLSALQSRLTELPSDPPISDLFPSNETPTHGQ